MVVFFLFIVFGSKKNKKYNIFHYLSGLGTLVLYTVFIGRGSHDGFLNAIRKYIVVSHSL
jgi:hypothetical protein